MTHLLAIETSSNQLGCAVANPEGILAANSISESRKHGELLAPTIQQTIAQSKLSPAQFDCIATDIGPGLYTGLRVGLAAASALAYAWDIPAVGLSSCEILAHGARDFDGILVPVIDARRGQVFFAAYRCGAAGSGGGGAAGSGGGGAAGSGSADLSVPTELLGAQVGSPDALAQALQDWPVEVPKLLVGDITGDLAESLVANLATSTDVRHSEISVTDLAELALLKLDRAGIDLRADADLRAGADLRADTDQAAPEGASSGGAKNFPKQDLPGGGYICAAGELRPLYLREPDIGPSARS